MMHAPSRTGRPRSNILTRGVHTNLVKISRSGHATPKNRFQKRKKKKRKRYVVVNGSGRNDSRPANCAETSGREAETAASHDSERRRRHTGFFKTTGGACVRCCSPVHDVFNYGGMSPRIPAQYSRHVRHRARERDGSPSTERANFYNMIPTSHPIREETEMYNIPDPGSKQR